MAKGRRLAVAISCMLMLFGGLAARARAVTLAVGEDPKVGLERYFQYESIDTGAGSQAHVNVATGNFVWQWTPMTNLGRGLSSVLTLTYNSREPGQNAPYREVGEGFSLSLSSITRINEPLDVSGSGGGNIDLADADGTRHRFERSALDPNVYDPPAGVNLRLRRFSTVDLAKSWAGTTPDGVTHYWDSRGTLTSIEDRNGNVLRFEYEQDGNSGSDCDVPGSSCHRRVVRVTDSAGVLDSAPNRSIVFRYYPDSAPSAVRGHIQEIEDHAGRVASFVYDADDGLLTDVIQAKGTPQERRITFGYDADREVASITDPRGNVTHVAYRDGSDSLSGSSNGRVGTLTDRHGAAMHFAYTALPDANVKTAVADRRGFTTTYVTDPQARLTQRTDARGTVTNVAWDDDNNPQQITEAAGTPDQAVTQMAFNANGLVTRQTDPVGHVTTIAYRDGAGTARSELGVDDNGTFVSDLTTVVTPRGNVAGADPSAFTWRFDPDAAGNVTAQTAPGGATARAAYDARGDLTSATDEVGDVTRYDSFDPNGLPRLKTDARGTRTADPNDGRWIYRYDGVGNVLAATDPRGATSGTVDDPRTAFTTTFSYDALDRLSTERRPKQSTAATPTFATRTYEYDANGNQSAFVDGTGKRSERTFTAMDDVATDSTPAVDHDGESAPAAEVTGYQYDDEQHVTVVTRPEGTRTTSVDGDFSTQLVHDEIGETVARLERSVAPSGPATHATSYAYDRRGNVIGLVDPRRNAQFGGTPADNATIESRRRFTYQYDLADNRTDQIEDPGDRKLRTRFTYDADDNQISVTDPRGFDAGATTAPFTSHREYDARDLLSAVVDPLGNRTQYERRDDGRMSAITAPRGTASTTAGDFQTRLTYYPTGELQSRTLPFAPGQYGLDTDAQGNPVPLKVVYDRNPVGDPTTITDARGHAFANTFLDDGELLTTDRPSWWTADDAAGDADPTQVLSWARGGLREKTDDERGNGGDQPQLPQSEGKGDLGDTSPAPMPDVLPRAGHTTFDYDDEWRLVGVTDVAGKTTTLTRDGVGRVTQVRRPFSTLDKAAADITDADYIIERFGFDRNGNLRRSTDGEANATTTAYDQFDRAITETAPGQSAGAPEVTQRTYDENDNVKTVQTPRGPSFTATMAYDGIDELISQTDPAGDATTFTYDSAGNKTSERAPNGNVAGIAAAEQDSFTTRFAYDGAGELRTVTDGLGQPTTYDYDADGNQIRVTAPGAKKAPTDAAPATFLTERSFDGRDLPWSTTVGRGAGDARTTVTEFDPNGNLRRVVNPAGVDESTRRPKLPDSGTDGSRNATVREYSDDDILTGVRMPWDKLAAGQPGVDSPQDKQNARRFRMDFHPDTRGRIDTVTSPYEEGAADANKSVTGYTHFDTGWIRTSSDPHLTDASTGQQIYEQTIEYQYDKRGLQTLWSSIGHDREIRRAYFPNGLLESRNATTATEDRGYTYAYNPNESLTQMVDVQKARTTAITVDAAERQTLVNETWASGKDTRFDYDPNGNVKVRYTDGTNAAGGSYQGGKTSTFTYDPLDRETKAVIAQGADTRTTTTDYWPSGDIATRTAPNHSVETRFYDSADLLRLMRRQASGTNQLVKDQAYEYDTNGNRKQDERGSYEFNPRDQLDRWQRSHNGPKPDTVVNYAVDGSGQIESEKDNGTTTTYSYVGDRLRSATRAGVTTTFTYDDFGATKTIDAGAVHTKFDYDPFERLVGGRGPGAPADDVISYDGLDRRDTKKQNGATVADYSYVGLSESLSREQSPDGSRIRSYDYDADGQRLGQAAKDGTAALRYRNYSLDADGSVEGLEDDTGQIPETRNPTTGQITATDHYYYDPFGRLDTDKPNPATPADNDQGLSAAAKDNPFRYQGFYTDPQTRTQDMHARVYGITQARFLTQDRYEDALGDLNLVSDPTTNNRYAFLDANPISNVEQDGHCGRGDNEPCAPLGRPRTKAEKNKASEISGDQTRAQRSKPASRQSKPPTGPVDLCAEYPSVCQPQRPQAGEAPPTPRPRRPKPVAAPCMSPRALLACLASASGQDEEPENEPKSGPADLSRALEAFSRAFGQAARCVGRGALNQGPCRVVSRGRALARGGIGDSDAEGGVYVLRDPATDDVVRTGRTGNLARRALEHDRSPRLGRYRFQTVFRTDDHAARRGLEEALDAHFKEPPLNKVRAIDARNPSITRYREAARHFLDTVTGDAI